MIEPILSRTLDPCRPVYMRQRAFPFVPRGAQFCASRDAQKQWPTPPSGQLAATHQILPFYGEMNNHHHRKLSIQSRQSNSVRDQGGLRRRVRGDVRWLTGERCVGAKLEPIDQERPGEEPRETKANKEMGLLGGHSLGQLEKPHPPALFAPPGCCFSGLANIRTFLSKIAINHPAARSTNQINQNKASESRQETQLPVWLAGCLARLMPSGRHILPLYFTFCPRN